ncbi:hypothetical protein [Streptomyces sp. T028]|uniref:hypothetical protein n=1 Tax=Streptomyces sp. T028 TaxID=3394379 RepID=UPI003A8BD780
MRAARALVLHEIRLLVSLALWAARRLHGVGDGRAFGYVRGQGAMTAGFAFVCLVETFTMSVLLRDRPTAHRIRLVEVGGAGRVDREEGGVSGVVRRQRRGLRRAPPLSASLERGGDPHRLGQDAEREGERDLELGAQCVEGGPQDGLGGAPVTWMWRRGIRRA